MNTQIPVAPVQGNHEFYTTEWEVDLPIAYDKFFDLPSNGTDKYKNLYYSLIMVMFISLYSIHKMMKSKNMNRIYYKMKSIGFAKI